jgi:AcrR family transcriptional regulator
MARKLDPELDAAIAAATLQLLGEVGFDRLSIAAVATRAGTARTSIYRRWPDKTALVVAAVKAELGDPRSPKVADAGSLRDDLLAHATRLAARMGDMRTTVLSGLLTAIRDNAELGALVRSSIVSRDGEIVRSAVRRAIARGELMENAADDPLIASVGVSMMFARAVLMDLPLDKEYVTELVDRVVVPLYQPYARC